MHSNFTLHTSLQGEPPQQWLHYTCPRRTEWQKEGMKYWCAHFPSLWPDACDFAPDNYEQHLTHSARSPPGKIGDVATACLGRPQEHIKGEIITDLWALISADKTGIT